MENQNKSMIAKEELRTGNLLQYYTGEEGCEWEETAIDWQNIKWCTEDNENFNKVHKPIPLTEEWLKRLGANKIRLTGFIAVGATYWQIGNIIFYELKGKYRIPIGVTSTSPRSIIIEFDTVHELQNIYSLTGQELK